MLEQLTTHEFCGPTAVQEQLPGHGLQALPSAATPERASRQQSAKSRLENNPNFGRQTPCFRLNTICPFLQGIAHSHLIAPSVGEVFLGARGGKFTLFPVFPSEKRRRKRRKSRFPPSSLTSPLYSSVNGTGFTSSPEEGKKLWILLCKKFLKNFLSFSHPAVPLLSTG